MAIVSCSECGHGVSDKAAACPKCGNPILTTTRKDPANAEAVTEDFGTLRFNESRRRRETSLNHQGSKSSVLSKLIVLGIAVGVIYGATQLLPAFSIGKAKEFVRGPNEAYEGEQPKEYAVDATGEATSQLNSEAEAIASSRPDDATIIATLRDAAQAGVMVRGVAIPAEAVEITNIVVDQVDALDGSNPAELYKVRATISSKITQGADFVKQAILKRNRIRAPATLEEMQNPGELVNRAISRHMTVTNATNSIRIGTEVRFILDAQIRSAGGAWNVVSAQSIEIPLTAEEIAAEENSSAEQAAAVAEAVAARAAEGSASSRVELDQEASVHQTPPRYPTEEQARGITGTVVLVVAVDETGNFSDVWVERSSGNRNLDSAAVQASHNWTFTPEIQGGKPVASKVRVPVEFSLN